MNVNFFPAAKRKRFINLIIVLFVKVTWPYAWHPNILETQLLRIGQVMIAPVPGEFTTMAGRRFREAIDLESSSNGGPSNTKTVIAGLSNVYSHYITTFEEYQV